MYLLLRLLFDTCKKAIKIILPYEEIPSLDAFHLRYRDVSESIKRNLTAATFGSNLSLVHVPVHVSQVDFWLP